MAEEPDIDTSNPANEMTFLEHLEEMRGVILKSLTVFTLAFLVVIVGFYYFNKLMLFPLNQAKEILNSVYVTADNIENPEPEKMGPVYLVEEKDGKEHKTGPFYIVAKDKDVVLSKDSNRNWVNDIKLRSMSITTPIFVWLSVGFLGSLGMSLPLIMYFIARFITPGLTKEELRMLAPGVAAGVVLFFIGATFAFCFMLPMGIAFMAFMSQGMQLEMFPDAMSYYSMVIFVTIATGITFELPLLECVLIYLGILNVDWLKKNRRTVFLIIIVFAAVVTPPDVITQVSLAIPLYFLYEASLRIGIRLRKRKLAKEAAIRAKEEAEEAAEHKEYVQQEAKRRLAEIEEEKKYDAAKEMASDDEDDDEYAEYGRDPYESEFDDLDNLEDDYGMGYYDEASHEGYIDYGELANPKPDPNLKFSPNWELNAPDTSALSPNWSLNETENEPINPETDQSNSDTKTQDNV